MDFDLGSSGSGIIVPDESEDQDDMNILSHSVLDDVLTNIIHDLVQKTHREEKIAKANTAAILIEALAANVEPPPTPSSSSLSRSPQKPLVLETTSARFDDGEVYLRGNPLKTITELRCPKCNLPKVLDPTDGIGAKPLDDEDENGAILYCARRPYISKPGHDIYGLPFPTEDSKAPRKNGKNKTAQSTQDTSSDAIMISSRDDTMIKTSFPTTKCQKCDNEVPVRTFRKHLMVCMGIASRSSGRAAVIKASSQSMNNTSSQAGTPPASRKGTPVLTSSFTERFSTTSIKDKEKDKKASSKRSRSHLDDDSSELSDDFDDDDDMYDVEDLGNPKKKKKLSDTNNTTPSSVTSTQSKPKIPIIKISNKASALSASRTATGRSLSPGTTQHRDKSANSKAHTSSSSNKSHSSNTHSTASVSQAHGQKSSTGLYNNSYQSSTSPNPHNTLKQSRGSGFNGSMGKMKHNVKKWKSGKITVEDASGRRIERERDGDGKGGA